MNIPQISVIVPVYNVEKYLTQCIESILSQTYQEFELLLIDDGSEDNSGSICDHYSNIDSRVHVFHKENGGVSSARNMGIEHAKGEWVCFVDSDDWIDKDTFEYITGLWKGADFLQFGYRRTGGTASEYSYVPGKVLRYSTSVYCTKRIYHSAICGYLLKLNIIKKYKISFPNHIKYGEDQAFILKTLICSSEIVILDRHFYNYRDREGSAMHASESISMGKDHLLVIEDLLLFIEHNRINLPPLYLSLFRTFVMSFFWISVRSIKSVFDIVNIKRIYSNFLKSNNLSFVLPVYFRMLNSYLFIVSYYGYVRLKKIKFK